MKKSSKRKITKVLIALILFILLVVFTMFLYSWSSSLNKEYKRDQLRENVTELLELEGERGLLSLAGVTVNEIFYSEDSLSLAIDNGENWLYTSEEMQNIRVYEKCSDSVVHISGANKTTDYISYEKTNTSGSGVILSTKGDILTNYHVIENLDIIKVTLADGSSYTANIVGLDEVEDIALINIDVDKKKLNPIELGKSFNLKVGQKVYAIGNPFGYDRTLTTGIISGLDRSVQTSDGKLIMSMIQTDAAINPGNSGGPLINSHSEMIAMNTSIYNENGNSGMNFAIPIDTILSIIPDLITYGKVMRGSIDIVPVQLTPQLAEYAKIKVSKGILISQVVKNGKAQEAGLLGGDVKVSYGASTLYLGGDVIVKINDYPVETYTDYYNALLTTRMGENAEVTIIRDGKELVKTVELVSRSEDEDKVEN
jgi:S1-C subfamily serine protease